MKKKEMRLYAAQLVESGKGLALAELMEEGESKKAAIDLFNKSIDDTLKQLELLCSDCTFKEVEEFLDGTGE